MLLFACLRLLLHNAFSYVITSYSIHYTKLYEIRRLQKSAEYISVVDSLVSLATVANENGYCKPEINTDGIIDIKSGRHPVVEAASNINSFVPNNAYLDMADDRFIIITGPNMSGKSTYRNNFV